MWFKASGSPCLSSILTFDVLRTVSFKLFSAVPTCLWNRGSGAWGRVPRPGESRAWRGQATQVNKTHRCAGISSSHCPFPSSWSTSVWGLFIPIFPYPVYHMRRNFSCFLNSLYCWFSVGPVWEYTRGTVFLAFCILGDLPPPNAASYLFPSFFSRPNLSLRPLQERPKFSTQKGVVQVLLVFRIDFVYFRSSENRFS